jgi:hypothetical protein
VTVHPYFFDYSQHTRKRCAAATPKIAELYFFEIDAINDIARKGACGERPRDVADKHPVIALAGKRDDRPSRHDTHSKHASTKGNKGHAVEKQINAHYTTATKKWGASWEEEIRLSERLIATSAQGQIVRAIGCSLWWMVDGRRSRPRR